MNINVRVRARRYLRGDAGMVVPNDGHTYVRVRHEIDLLGRTRHADNGANDPMPAVANTAWGIWTVNNGNTYHEMREAWQWFFYHFWDAMSGGLLPVGKHEGQYKNPKNPRITYDIYTAGSKLALYAGMIADAVAFTDASSPETGARDYVTGRNPSAKVWSWLKGRPTTGAILRVKARRGTKLQIACLDLDRDPPDPYGLEFWQYFYCTQVHIDGRVTRFPQMKNAFAVHGWEPVGTPAPLASPGGYFEIDRNACVELRPGEVWQPYLLTV